MLLILSLLVVLVQGAVRLSSAVAESGPVLHIHEDGISGFVDIDRSKRSLPTAIDTLLKSAVMKYSTGHYKEFWKKGTYKDALKVFKRANPTHISRTQFETAGYVGNKMITVSRSKNQNSNTANIRIFDVYEKNGIMLKSSTGEIYISYKIFLKNE